MTVTETFQRYRDLIKTAMSLAPSPDPRQLPQERAVYRPLALYRRLIDFQQQYETLPRQQFGQLDEELRRESEQLESETAFERPSAIAAWSALALYVAGKIFIRDAWTDLAADTFGRLCRGQQEGGRFLPTTSSIHPEAAWYDELATLHAAASYAVQAEDRVVARAVARSANFISREIEPDHATAQPWGLFAFIWNEPTRPLADQLLHSVALKAPNLDGVSLILLEDALYCLRLFVS